MSGSLTEAVKIIRQLKRRADRLEEQAETEGKSITKSTFVTASILSNVVSVSHSVISSPEATYNDDNYNYGEYQ